MNYRKLGDTDLSVSEIGLGAWQLGNEFGRTEMSHDEAVRMVHQAIDLGCNFFDTAPNYASGKSEILLGKALKGKRDRVIINTKFGHHPDDIRDFNPKKMIPSIENSLKSLQTDYIDSVIMHNPEIEYLNGNAPHWEIFERLVEQGKIRYYGASVDWSNEIQEVLTTTNSKLLEILFNIFHQEPRKSFPLVKEKGAGVIVKVPLDSGWLSGKYNPKSSFKGARSRWSDDVIQRRAQMLDKIIPIIGENNMVHAALRFILSFKETSTIIPGAKNINQLEHNLAASDEKMATETIQNLKKFWEEELKDNPLPW